MLGIYPDERVLKQGKQVKYSGRTKRETHVMGTWWVFRDHSVLDLSHSINFCWRDETLALPHVFCSHYCGPLLRYGLFGFVEVLTQLGRNAFPPLSLVLWEFVNASPRVIILTLAFHERKFSTVTCPGFEVPSFTAKAVSTAKQTPRCQPLF